MEKNRKEFVEIELKTVRLNSGNSVFTESLFTQGCYDPFGGENEWWDETW